MRVLVTGATGFVGSHLVEALARKSGEGDPGPAKPQGKGLIRVLIRESSDTSLLAGLDVQRTTGHLGDEAALEEAVAKVDVVLHLAALTRARSEGEFLAANETGTRNLLDAARGGGTVKRFIYVSSLAAVGPAREGRPVTAGDEPRPLTAYGRSKLAGERACLQSQDDLSVTILRPPAVYGPRDRDILPFFRLASRGILPVPTGPTRTLQMIHVSDLVEAIVGAAQTPDAVGVYHVAETQSYPWPEIMEFMARAVGRKGYIVPLPQRAVRAAGALSAALGRVMETPPIFDGDKARELLAPGWLCETEAASNAFGFNAEIPLERGLRETAAWYRGRGWLP